jgi:uncharacterized protein YoxC
VVKQDSWQSVFQDAVRHDGGVFSLFAATTIMMFGLSARVGETNVKLETLAGETNASIVELRNELRGLDKKVDGLVKKVDGLDKKVDGLVKKVDGLDKKIDGLDKKIDGIDKKVVELRNEVRGLTLAVIVSAAILSVINSSVSGRGQ